MGRRKIRLEAFVLAVSIDDATAEMELGDDDEPDTISKDETRSDAPTPEPVEPPSETENELSASLAKPESKEAPPDAVEAPADS